MDQLDHIRAEYAARYLAGDGIEIGAFGRPLQVAEGTRIRYLDKYPSATVLQHHNMPPDSPVLEPDILDDGTTLETILDRSLDFIAACHFLEHCEDLIGTLKVHFRKVRQGGILFYILPDKNRMFDHVRKSTRWDHHLADHEDRGACSREDHIWEWCNIVMPGTDPEKIRAEPEQIHFHCWTAAEQRQLIKSLRFVLPPFNLEGFFPLKNWPEVVIVLKVL